MAGDRVREVASCTDASYPNICCDIITNLRAETKTEEHQEEEYGPKGRQRDLPIEDSLNRKMYIHISYLEKSRHPRNWLPSLRGQKQRKGTKNDVKLQKINPKSKEKFA